MVNPKKQLDPSVSVRFDHVWVIRPSLFDDSDIDPQVGNDFTSLQAIFEEHISNQH